VSRRGDTGAATVVVMATCAVLALAGGVVTEAGLAAVTRHRAALAADAAAIAAATHADSGPDVACAEAKRALALAGARLVSCAVDGPFAVVRDRVAAPGWLAWAGSAAGVARAGPDTNAEETGGVAQAS
jgi:secretion/DNA translocation related TadE-like protein